MTPVSAIRTFVLGGVSVRVVARRTAALVPQAEAEVRALGRSLGTHTRGGWPYRLTGSGPDWWGWRKGCAP